MGQTFLGVKNLLRQQLLGGQQMSGQNCGVSHILESTFFGKNSWEVKLIKGKFILVGQKNVGT